MPPEPAKRSAPDGAERQPAHDVALGNERDRFADRVRDYFAAWIDALAAALVRTGRKPQEANALAREVVGGIQGALVLARAFDQTDVFTDALASLQERLLTD